MDNLKQIEEKEKELDDMISKYEKEIKEMKWKYVEDKYGLNKGCVCLINDRYAYLFNINKINEYGAYLDFSFIGIRGGLLGRETFSTRSKIIKKFNSLKDFDKYLEDYKNKKRSELNG